MSTPSTPTAQSGSFWSPSRVVAILTAILAPVAGYASTLLATLPGVPHLSSASITAVFVAGVFVVGAVGWKWLEGQSSWEIETRHLAVRLQAAALAVAPVLPDGQVKDDVAKLTAGLNAVTEELDKLKHAPPATPSSVKVGDTVFVPAASNVPVATVAATAGPIPPPPPA